MFDIFKGFQFKKDDQRMLQASNKMEMEIRSLKACLEAVERQNQLLRLPWDDLTQVYQDHAVMAVLNNEIRNGKITKSPVTVALFDIDLLKLVNDIYGLTVGDETMIQIASILKNNLTIPRAFLGRTWGDEFTVIFPDMDYDLVVNECRKIQKLIEEAELPNGTRDSAYAIPEYMMEKLCGREFVTVSVGILSRVPSPEDTYESFMEQVKEVLYRGKRNGYNVMKVE